MFIRLLGTALVLFSCTLLGIYFSLKESFRIRDLTEFKKALLLLKGEIEFSHSPIGEALAFAASKADKRLEKFFLRVSDDVKLWRLAVSHELSAMSFSKEDLAAIARLSETMGFLSKQTQLEGIEMCSMYIDGQADKLRETESKNKRLYRGGGVIFGLLIVILLI